MKKSDLLLHPVRMRIVQALLGSRELTTAQLQTELPDVPAATLYRQVAALLKGGALEVTDERRVRGTFERTYRVRPENTHVGPEDAAAMTPEEHSAAFLAFMTARLSDFERYLAAGEPDLERDRVGYRMAALHLSGRGGRRPSRKAPRGARAVRREGGRTRPPAEAAQYRPDARGLDPTGHFPHYCVSKQSATKVFTAQATIYRRNSVAAAFEGCHATSRSSA